MTSRQAWLASGGWSAGGSGAGSSGGGGPSGAGAAGHRPSPVRASAHSLVALSQPAGSGQKPGKNDTVHSGQVWGERIAAGGLSGRKSMMNMRRKSRHSFLDS